MFNKKKIYRRIDQSISASSKVMIRKCFGISAATTRRVPRRKTMPEQTEMTRTMKAIRIGRDFKRAMQDWTSLTQDMLTGELIQMW
jgi:hypothetical protein